MSAADCFEVSDRVFSQLHSNPQSLGISRTTVTQNYEQILSEGYLQTIVGSGIYICTQLPDDGLCPTPVELNTEQNT